MHLSYGTQRLEVALPADRTTVVKPRWEPAREIAMAPVEQQFEVVLTTSAGYPLDRNLDQAVKGTSAGR